MKEHGVIFNAEMVRAILAGTKTMTRRIDSKYKVGERLWVRENCRAVETADGLDGVFYPADGSFRPIENTQEASTGWCVLNGYRGKRGAVVPSIHMPRWASRIRLEVTAVRFERLRMITVEDINAEGTPTAIDHALQGDPWWSFADYWDSLYGKSEHAWDLNPIVQATSFRVIEL